MLERRLTACGVQGAALQLACTIMKLCCLHAPKHNALLLTTCLQFGRPDDMDVAHAAARRLSLLGDILPDLGEEHRCVGFVGVLCCPCDNAADCWGCSSSWLRLHVQLLGCAAAAAATAAAAAAATGVRCIKRSAFQRLRPPSSVSSRPPSQPKSELLLAACGTAGAMLRQLGADCPAAVLKMLDTLIDNAGKWRAPGEFSLAWLALPVWPCSAVRVAVYRCAPCTAACYAVADLFAPTPAISGNLQSCHTQ